MVQNRIFVLFKIIFWSDCRTVNFRADFEKDVGISFDKFLHLINPLIAGRVFYAYVRQAKVNILDLQFAMCVGWVKRITFQVYFCPGMLTLTCLVCAEKTTPGHERG